MIHYWADPHIGHRNILNYCGRPFATIEQHDQWLWDQMFAVQRAGDLLVCGGDFCFRPRTFRWGEAMRPDNHLIVIGNHDRERTKLKPWFGSMIGTHKTYQTNAALIQDEVDGRDVWVQVSHVPLAGSPPGPLERSRS